MNSFPYQKSDENGIRRARARGLFLLHTSRANILTVLKREYGGLSHPGIYMLFKEGTRKTYIGESADLQDRIAQWTKTGPKEFRDWDNVVIINDMRQIKYSDLAVTDVRKKIEKNLLQTLKENDYVVANKQEAQPKLSDEQSRFADGLLNELEFLITEYRLIRERKKEKVRQDELSIEKTKYLLGATGRTVETLSAYEGVVEGKRVFVRPGSLKPKGWQITLRDEFRNSVKNETGYLLVNRAGGLLIPFESLRGFLGKKLDQSTVDIFVQFESNNRAKVFYKKKELDVSQFFIQ